MRGVSSVCIPAIAVWAGLAALSPGAPVVDGDGIDHAAIYELLPDSSTVRVHTGSSGLLGFAGHDHTIAVPRFTGRAAVDSTDLSRFTLAIDVPAATLAVVDPDEDAETRARIEKDMREKVLTAGDHPTLSLRGRRFAPENQNARGFGSHRGHLTVALTLHGVTREIRLPITLDIDRNRLRARGEFAIEHSDFDLHRIKVAGVVNVAETIAIDFDVAGRATTPETGP